MANPVPTMLRICTGQVFWSGHVYRARAMACCNTWKLPLILSFPFPSSCEAGLDADFHISTHVSLSSLVSLAVPVDLSLKGSLTLRHPFQPRAPSPTRPEVQVHFIRFHFPKVSPVQRELGADTW